jgi:hypothetical protein
LNSRIPSSRFRKYSGDIVSLGGAIKSSEA